ncbi:hypothetical protein [Aquimarina spongiae]|uniref:Uncharacterized protein n=1 Tax=Aquimarina spongiae TaxID=570521 RepID=A0A1M6IW05_9FLAO|nr:hypothetical protein [Aquimarina spongiae]SHJ38592.1 hypothetical protein SAMN04488508_10897 [Aquimarina spongiae]
MERVEEHMNELINIINQIIELDKENSLKKHLGFDIKKNAQNFKSFMDSGWWCCFLLGHRKFGKYDVALRLTPNANWNNWNLVRVNSKNSAYTISNNIFSLPILRQRMLAEHDKVFVEFKDRFEKFESEVKPTYEILGILDQLDFMRVYVNDSTNIPNGTDGVDRYLKFLYRYDSSESHKIFREKLSEMIKLKDLMPNSVTGQDFGAWDQLFRNIVARRGVDYSNAIPLDQLSPILWNAFVLPHGFDTVGHQLSHYPDTGTPPEILIKDIARLLTADYYEFSSSITEHPLYSAAKAISEKGGSYVGVEHAEAAAILDDKLKDPVGAWNALVSAAFWAGINNGGEKMQITLWDQAIWLSKKEDWKDVYSVLSYQRKIYEEIK